MKKTYWWRIAVMIGSIALFVIAISISDTLGRSTFSYSFDGIMLLLLCIFVISPVLFLVNDFIFIRWLHFSIVCFFVSIVLFIITNIVDRKFLPYRFDSEAVGIFVCGLFLIGNFVKIGLDSWKQEMLLEKRVGSKKTSKRTYWVIIATITLLLLSSGIIYIVNTTMLNGMM